MADNSAEQQRSIKRAAFERLMSENEAVMLRVARRMCGGDMDRAQDLVQESLINAYRAFVDGRFREGTNARAWLLTILTNVYRNDYRRAGRESATEQLEELISSDRDASGSLITDKSKGPAEALLSASLEEPLERALSKLSDEFRACII